MQAEAPGWPQSRTKGSWTLWHGQSPHGLGGCCQGGHAWCFPGGGWATREGTFTAAKLEISSHVVL